MLDVKPAQAPQRAIGFWGCWALAVGTMIGTGIFLLPASLAPFGLLSFVGWLLTAAGTILLVLAIGRLAGRTTRSGGLQVYVEDQFGRTAGFLTAWLYWVGCWTATPTMAIAFVGYLSPLASGLSNQPVLQQLIALALIWTLTLVSLRGAKEMSVVQIASVALKILPLAAIIGLALFKGDAANLPAFNPSGAPPLKALSQVAMLTMFAFIGFEIAALPADNVKDPQRTMPKAMIAAVLTVATIYIASVAAVMLLVPSATLQASSAPFADAARSLGSWGPVLVTLATLVSTAGVLNGNIFASGQVPMAAANDAMAPRALALLNKAGAPWVALVLGSVLGSILVPMNFSHGLKGALDFLLAMTTLTTLLPYAFCALAEIKASWRSARGWVLLSIVAGLYTLFAIFGSGREAIGWSLVLSLAGLPVYFLIRPRAAAATPA